METDEAEAFLGNSEITIKILEYLKNEIDDPFDVGLIESLIELQEEQIMLILNLHNGESKQFI